MLEAAAGTDSQEDDNLAPTSAVTKETTSVGSVDRVGPEAVKPPESARVDGGKQT